MKNIILLSLLVLALFSACKKDAANGTAYYVFADKNDKTDFYSTQPNAGFRSTKVNDTLYLNSTYRNEHLTIRIIAKGPGAYKSPNLDAVYFTDIGGDVGGQTYHLNSDPGNIVNITNIDQNIIQGSFDLTFKETTRSLQGAPSILAFSRGRFRSQIGSNKTDVEWLFTQM